MAFTLKMTTDQSSLIRHWLVQSQWPHTVTAEGVFEFTLSNGFVLNASVSPPHRLNLVTSPGQATKGLLDCLKGDNNGMDEEGFIDSWTVDNVRWDIALARGDLVVLFRAGELPQTPNEWEIAVDEVRRHREQLERWTRADPLDDRSLAWSSAESRMPTVHMNWA